MLSRRLFLGQAGSCLTAAALAELLGLRAAAAQAGAKSDPLAPRRPHFEPRAKQVIYLHMIGAPSQIDLFDEKPELVRRHEQPCPPEVTKGRDFAFINKTSVLAGSPYRFAQHGESGQVVSELMPHLARVVDELCVIRSMHTQEINHASGQMFLHTGFPRGGRPSFGAWTAYGLGSENQNLPAFVVLVSGQVGGAGTSLWSTGFLPSIYQGVPFRTLGDPVLFLSNPAGHEPDSRRRVLDALGELNHEHQGCTGDAEIETRIRQYEMAFRMQSSVPDLMDLGTESPETLALYGAVPGKSSFANNCLLACRLIERGVRVVELFDSTWDHHVRIDTGLPKKCAETDQGVAALIQDLRRRGLLDQTLVVWGAEFGRTPLRQNNDKGRPGRDHHKDAFTVWLAGGGTKRGLSYGKTDEFGMDVIENPVHVHDLNATILHLLGFDHERLTYRYQGREFRLTDIAGKVVHDLLA